ncbi:MAG: hypothetical protein HOY79_16510 [Streptomyces sp.]|nr:hypothetical protein [Streptomyces sp.]
MTEVARSAVNSSEVERGEVPELARLGNMLRDLFNILGISQRQYAYRVGRVPSDVSRFLGGRRRPPRDFVDRLISEVETEQGAALTAEAREKIEATWLLALKACDPGEYRLESLRTELARARRDTERANRTVQGLQLLLEQKEAQVREAGRELAQLQLDWVAERADATRAEIELCLERESVTTSREALLREIEDLKSTLREARRQWAETEERCRELRERVLRLEAELAERGAVAEVPLEAFKAQLELMWEEGSFPEATRELTEAAWARPVDEVVDLVRWLVEKGGGGSATAFVADVCRLCPVEVVLPVVEEFMAGYDKYLPDEHALVDAIAARVTVRDVAAFCQGLADLGRLGEHLSESVLTWAVLGVAAPSDAVDLIVQALTGRWSPDLFRAVAGEIAYLNAGRPFPYLVALGLFEAGQPEAANTILNEVIRSSRRGRETPGEEVGVLYSHLRKLDERSLRTLFAFITAQAPRETAERFAKEVHLGAALSGDRSLLDCVNQLST